MPINLRWFQIIYLTTSTYYVGTVLGQLANLKTEIAEIKRHHAWERRKMTKRFVNEIQAYEHDDKVDQYEYLVASLLVLGKLSSEDIQPIMAKFRDLSGSKGYISVENDIHDDDLADAPPTEEEDEALPDDE